MAEENITDDFRGIPMSHLIAAPLTASCEAQSMLGDTMIKFINTLAYGDPDPAAGQAGQAAEKIKTLPMKVERPLIQEDGSVTSQSVTVAPPLLGLVPIPALLIESVSVDFEMEVHSNIKNIEGGETEKKVDGRASYGLGMFKASVEVHGKITTHRENTRETDKTAKYHVHVEARQQPPTEGMSKLMDLMAVASEPIKIEVS